MPEPPTLPKLLTAEELLYLNLPDMQTELVRGVLVVREPPGYRHGLVAFAVAARIGEFVREHGLGVVVAAETGFKLFADPIPFAPRTQHSSVAIALRIRHRRDI